MDADVVRSLRGKGEVNRLPRTRVREPKPEPEPELEAGAGGRSRSRSARERSHTSPAAGTGERMETHPTEHLLVEHVRNYDVDEHEEVGHRSLDIVLQDSHEIAWHAVAAKDIPRATDKSIG